jgi:hypothetical protein
MENSKRTTVKNRLKKLYDINLNKNEFYRMVCGFNDNVLKLKNFTEAIDHLYDMSDVEFYNFYGYVYDVKYMEPVG